MPKLDVSDSPPKKKDTSDTSNKTEICDTKTELEKCISAASQKCKTLKPPASDNFKERMRSLRKPTTAKPPVPSALQLQTSKLMTHAKSYVNTKLSLAKTHLNANLNKEQIMCAIKCGTKWIWENCNPRQLQKMSAPGKPSLRAMKYPYTFSAKFAQFPLKHYISNQWIWKYYVASFAICIPLFYSINKLANSPGNVAKWAEIRRKEAEEHHH